VNEASPSPSALPLLRTAVIGLGRIGFGHHVPAVLARPGYELVAVMDPLPERRFEAQAQWAVPGFADVGEMLQVARPDLVVVASPTRFHVDHALAALRSGARVLCDKPVATDLAEFDRIGAEAGEGRRFLAFQPYRLSPQVRSLRAVLEKGLIGRVHEVRRSREGYVRRADWQAFLQHGGGLLNNYASHHFDEFLALFPGRKARTVFCHVQRVASLGDAEDVVKAVVVNEDGCIFQLDTSQASALAGPSWLVHGSHGSARWDDDAQCWLVRHFDPAEAPLVAPSGELAAAGRSYGGEDLPWRESRVPAAPEVHYYDAAHAYFTRGAEPPVSLAGSRALLELIERCRRSAATGATA
jgi:scyllo-inositol 2-dehydrogenase (NADP+)